MKKKHRIKTTVASPAPMPQAPAPVAAASEFHPIRPGTFFKNGHAEIAVVVAEAPDAIAFVSRPSGGTTLAIDSTTRSMFLREWNEWEPKHQPLGSPEPTPIPINMALRKIMHGATHGLKLQFGPGAFDALTSCFPSGDICYFDLQDGLIHHFKSVEDAAFVAAERGGTAIIFETAAELARCPHNHLVAVAAALDVNPPPAKVKATYIKELFDMAIKAKAKKAKKVAKVQAKAKRADGPVAKARACFDRASDPTDTAKMLEAAQKAGVPEGTAKTQLYKWRKEHGIKAPRGRPSSSGKKKTAKAKKPAKAKKSKPKPAAKKKEAKKPAKAKKTPTVKKPATVAPTPPAAAAPRPVSAPDPVAEAVAESRSGDSPEA